jgi:hypothetical protein
MLVNYPMLVVLLGSAGLIPFLGASYLHIQGADLAGLSGQTIFLSYSAIILSFMAGALWGQALEHSKQVSPLAIPILTNVVALTAWVSLLLPYVSISVVLLLVGFGMIYWTEQRWRLAAALVGGYYQTLRLVLTLSVCSLHLVMLVPLT